MQREKLSECDKLFEEKRIGSTDARPMLAADQVTELRKERRQGVLIRNLMADYGLKKSDHLSPFSFPGMPEFIFLATAPPHLLLELPLPLSSA